MEKILGIIAEYNPFHKGHRYQIEEAKKRSGAEYVVCLMSGCFVQRGEPALYPPRQRAKMALENGADAVFEMPAFFSVSSAESFAFYGVDFFDKLGADCLSFGAEHASFADLSLLAEFLSAESESFKLHLRKELKKGISFPSARQKALLAVLPPSLQGKTTENILNSPNNILGMEYLKALQKTKSSLELCIIPRSSNNYNKKELEKEGYSSASAVRKSILGNKTAETAAALPASVYRDVQEIPPLSPDVFLPLLDDLIPRSRYTGRDLDIYLDIDKDLGRHLQNSYAPCAGYEELVSSLKSRQYTYTRISRSLAHILLEMRKDDFRLFQSAGASYAGLLGFRKDSALLLHLLKERSKIPFITKPKDAKSKLSGPAAGLYEHNNYCSALYERLYLQKNKQNIKNQIVIV